MIGRIAIEILSNMEANGIYERKWLISAQKDRMQITREKEEDFKTKANIAMARLHKLGLINRVRRGYYIISELGINTVTTQREELVRKINKYMTQSNKNKVIAYRIFKKANDRFWTENSRNIEMNVSERSLCSSFAQCLKEIMKEESIKGYYADTEYNRNGCMVKTIINEEREIIEIICDLIVHSRGENVLQDNLLAIEMKKRENHREIEEDKKRLIIMTKDTYFGEIIFEELPRHICRYALGIYYNIDTQKREIELEYYEHGKKVREEKKTIDNN